MLGAACNERATSRGMCVYDPDVYDPKNVPVYTTVTVIHPPKSEQEMVDLAMQNSKETYEKEKVNKEVEQTSEKK